jgi:predicted transposase/invertase (TIGR01784 family)
MGRIIDDVDFTQLMDLRVDYAFKLFFTTGGTSRLISLLNAIFANKSIPRIITALTITNPSLEKAAIEDKLSTLDIRATLSDDSTVCVEMHLYGLKEFKYKSLRSWARAYGEELEPGQEYTAQKPVICVSFIDGPITDSSGYPIEKVHAVFHVMERDDHRILLPEMELHYINMRAFVEKVCNESTVCESCPDMFTKWLMLITQKEIADKEILRKICREEEVMKMAVETLVRLSQDKIKRQAYQRRLDELNSYNRALARAERADEFERRAEEFERRAEESERRAAESERRATESEHRAAEFEHRATESEHRATESERRATEESKRRVEAEESLGKTAKSLLGKHYSVAEIAEVMNLTEQKIKKLLSMD